MSRTQPPTPEPDAPEPDEALDRIRAADPARALEPDLPHLRVSVAARVAADDGADRPADHLAARRTRRRWPLVAAAAASALVIGGVGFALGRAGGGLPPAGGVIVLSVGEATGDAVATGDAEATGAGADLGAQDARSSLWQPSPWRTVFTASGLSDAAGSASAWAFDPAAVFSAESAEAAAAALGLVGEADLEYGAWTVGVQDGTGPWFSLQADGYASASFYDPSRDPYACVTPTDAARGAVGGVPCAEGSDVPAPRGSVAAAAMRDLLASLGLEATVEIETTEMDVPESGEPRATSVTAHQVRDGQRTGAAWSATFAGGGVQSFYGPLAPVVALGDYATVSENEAVRRLGDPRFGATWGGVFPLAADAATDAPTLPVAPEPGAAIPWPVTEVTITGARLGLTLQWLPDGAAVILPAYELTADDGAAWSVLAVADEGLDFAAE